MQNKRIEWIDIAKGLGIILVILGHVPRNVMRENCSAINMLYHFIYSFHMPLFFFLSGYVYTKVKEKYNDKIKFVLGKCRKILIPWLVYTILIFLIIFILNKIPPLYKYIKGTELSVINFFKYMELATLYRNPYAFHLWFLLVLFEIQIIFYFVDSTFKNKSGILKYVYYVLIIIFAIIHATTKIKIVPIRYAIRGSIYYLLGINLANHIEKESKISLKNITLTIIGLIITVVYIGGVSLKAIDITYIRIGVHLLEILVGAPLLIYSVIVLAKNIKSKFLIYLGRNSFTIYLLHQPFFCAFIGATLVKILPNNVVMYILIMVICAIASIVGPIVITKGLYKIGMGKVLTKIGISKM